MWSHPSSPVLRVATLCLCATLLPACGGGGSDGSDPVVEQPRVVLSAATEPRVTAVALDSLLQSQTHSALDALSAGGSGNTQIKLAALTGRQVAKRALQSAKSTVQVSISQTSNCAVSGSFTVSANVAVASAALDTAGDSATIDFNACVEVPGLVLDGGLGISVVSSKATLQVWDILTTNLSVTLGDLIWRESGTTRMTTDSRTAGVSTVTSTSARSSFFRSVGGQQRDSYALLDSTQTSALNTASGTVTATASFVASGSFNGLGDVSYKVETPVALQGPADAAHPSSGTVKVSGAAKRSLLLVLGPTSLRVLADFNGDGVADSDTTRTWEEIDALR